MSELARKYLEDQIIRDNKRHEEIGEKRGLIKGREEMLRVLRSKSGMTDEQIAEMFSMPIELITGLKP